jgi:hypothetical protein
MVPIAGQIIDNHREYYYKPVKAEVEKVSQNCVERLTDEEKRVQSIAFLTQYMDDLKAGKPVENLSPDNDPYFLVPENIAIWIEGEKSLLAGKGRVINSIKDIIGEWDI